MKNKDIFFLLLIALTAVGADRPRKATTSLSPIISTSIMVNAGVNQTIPGPSAEAALEAITTVIGGDTNGTVTTWTYTEGPITATLETTTGQTNLGTFIAEGAYTVQVTSKKGSYYNYDTMVIFVTDQNITNFIPKVTMTSPPNGALYTAPIDLTLMCDASDKDGSVVKVVYYNGMTAMATSTVAPFNAVFPNAPPTNYTIAALATDDRGATNLSPAVTVLVNPQPPPPLNVPPSIAITSPNNGSTVTNPTVVSFSATASDSDGFIDSVTFIDNGSIIASLTVAPYIVNFSPGVGTHELVAKAIDNSFAETSRTNILEVVESPNVPPTISLTSPANGQTYLTTDTIVVDASVSDSDGFIASVTFYKDSTPVGSDTTAPYSINLSGLSVGSHVLSATATDNEGGIGSSQNITINVTTPGVPPTVTLTSPVNGATYLLGSTVTLSANASDSDGTIASVSWFSVTSGNPEDAADPPTETFIKVDTSSPYSQSWTPTIANDFMLIAKASDNSGLMATSSPPVLIHVRVPIAPTVTLTSPTNGQTFQQVTNVPLNISMAATTSDPDALATSVAFWQYQPDVFLVSDSTSPYTGTWTNAPAGDYSLVAKVSYPTNAINTSPAILIHILAPAPQTVYVDAGPSKTAIQSAYQPYSDGLYAANAGTFSAYATSTNIVTSGNDAGDYKYKIWWVLGGLRSMYAATLDTNYMGRALTLCEGMVASAVVTDNSGKKNYRGPWASPYSPSTIAFELSEMQGGWGMISIAADVLQTPDLRAVWGSRATTIYNFIRDNLVNKIWITRNESAYYVDKLHNPSSTTTDKTLILGGCILGLNLCSTALGNSDNTTYGWPARSLEFANGAKNFNGAAGECFANYCYSSGLCGLVWKRGKTWDTSYTVMDTAHAGRIPPYIIDLYRAGQAFSFSYVTGIANDFARVIWTQSTSNPQFRNFIDGANGGYANRPAYNDGKMTTYALLSEFDDESLLASRSMISAIKAGQSNPSISFNSDVIDKFPLVAHAMRGVSARTPPYAKLDGIVQGSVTTSTNWTRASGPGTATILFPSRAATTVLFGTNSSSVGMHTFTLTVKTSSSTNQDSVIVTVQGPPAF